MSMIRAAHYDETIDELVKDPIIQAMAVSLTLQDVQGIHGTGFMQAALYEYGKRGGTVQSHIGGPAEALQRIVQGRAA
jgi:hypothetical protein